MTNEHRTAAASGEDRLERSLGFKEALTIGSGTMIGAGIFVFPGLAAGRAGAAATLSFGIGAAIALLVALPTSELASAMPRSGGGYHFVSRVLGPFAGTLVGVGQWLGLVFASAFYLAGFGFYAADAATRLGLAGSLPADWVGLAAAVALTAVGIVGTRTSGRLQDVVVAVLVLLLVVFLGWGVVRMTGLAGEPVLPGEFAPRGFGPVFGTAALVFTAYLGFEQIASVAGEVRDPGRNLPRSMVASVIGVGILYVLTILVATSVATPEELAGAGETALALVARELIGATGALLVAVAGLLATLSSANASILSSSRAVFALSRDRVVPESVSRVSHRFRTPHMALLITGAPIALLALLGRLEVLAEAASILFLVMFGLTCVALIVLRRRSPAWYRPSFRLPAAIPIAAVGGLASFALIAFMQPRSLLYGGGVLVLATAWHLLRRRHVELQVEPAGTTPFGHTATFLLATGVPDAPRLPDDLLDVFRGQRVVLLGWCEVPEQSAPEQVEDQLGADARAAVDRLADRLREHDVEVETDLAYSGRFVDSVDGAARERDSDVVVVLRPAESVRRILVPVQRPDMAPTLARHTAWFTERLRAGIYLLRGEREGEERGAGATDEADGGGIRRRFEEAGTEVDDLHVLEGDADRDRAIVERAADVDLVLLAEGRPDESGGLFGDTTRAVMAAVDVPVMVVRLRQE